MNYDGKDGPHSDSGGVKPFSIQTRFSSERERLAGGFTDADRVWRKQWLKDQVLAPNEPVTPPWYYRERFNPIRRAYMFPLNKVFEALTPVLGEQVAGHSRNITGRILMMIGAIYVGTYWLKYNGSHWTKTGGWFMASSKKYQPPGTVEKPLQPDDYYHEGFKNSPI